MRILPVFKGWTVDARLKEFRKVTRNGEITFLPFSTEEGDNLLTLYVRSLDVDSQEFREISLSIL